MLALMHWRSIYSPDFAALVCPLFGFGGKRAKKRKVVFSNPTFCSTLLYFFLLKVRRQQY